MVQNLPARKTEKNKEIALLWMQTLLNTIWYPLMKIFIPVNFPDSGGIFPDFHHPSRL
jgi:hypothetical protein